MRASFPLNLPPRKALIEELTFGKLFSATAEAPEDLHVTSRTPGISDAMVAALQLPQLLHGQELAASRIDPKCAAAGVFLIRILPGEGAGPDHVALVRARLRDHVALSGARRSHPQLVASVASLLDFQRFPAQIIAFARQKRAERVSMDAPSVGAWAMPASEASDPPELTAATDPALLAILSALCAPRAENLASPMPAFGGLDFADEADFLETLGLALHYLKPRRPVWSRLAVNVGFDAEFPGAAIRYLPSQQTPALRLSAAAFERLRDDLEGAPLWSRRPQAGARAQTILRHAPLSGTPLSIRKTAAPPVAAPAPRALTNELNSARFSLALSAYRQRSDKHAFANELFELAKRSSPSDGVAALAPNTRAAWRALETYRAPPPVRAPLGTLVDGALFHLDRIGDSQADALASAWLRAIDSALHESVVLGAEELAALEAGDLIDRLLARPECPNVQAILKASSALKSGDSLPMHRQKLADRLQAAKRMRASSESVGLSGLFLTGADAIYPAPSKAIPDARRDAASPLL